MLLFSLSGLCIFWLGQCFDAFATKCMYMLCLPSLHMPLLLGASLFINFCRIAMLSFLSWHKNTAVVFDKCGWLQGCCFVVITFMWKHKRIRKYFTGSFYTGYSNVRHSPNLSWTLSYGMLLLVRGEKVSHFSQISYLVTTNVLGECLLQRVYKWHYSNISNLICIKENTTVSLLTGVVLSTAMA